MISFFLLCCKTVCIKFFLNLNYLCNIGKKSSEEKEEAPPGEAIIPTLPDVKMCAAKAIARSARSGKLKIYI